MGRRNKNHGSRYSQGNKLQIFSKWKLHIDKGSLPLTYPPMVEVLVEYFSLYDRLPEGRQHLEPGNKGIEEDITPVLDELKQKIVELIAVIDQELTSLANNIDSTDDHKGTLDTIEKSALELYSCYIAAIKLAKSYAVNTASIAQGYKQLEKALSVRGEFESLKSLNCHRKEHLSWRYVYLGSFKSAFCSFLQSIESASKKPAWRRNLDYSLNFWRRTS